MLELPRAERLELWSALLERMEEYTEGIDELSVSPELDPGSIRKFLSKFDFQGPSAPAALVSDIASAMTRWQVHTPHPRYFGLFNPRPTTMGVAGDALVAAFNPQMAAWSHNPFAAEVEAHLVRTFGLKFGYASDCCDGTFCSGGMEANHTAVLTALVNRFPSFLSEGVRSLPGCPVFYASEESHHSLLKAARMCGLGANSVRQIAVDDQLRMEAAALADSITSDRERGFLPFLVAGTAGTTNAGAIDPLQAIGTMARKEKLWFHVDAAWGGAVALVPEMRPLLAGIENADSITFDAHKWLSVPMGAGLYLTRHPAILEQTFRISTAYMPKEAAGLDIVDPHQHSTQWSRRFIGLKVFLSLAVAGWDGYAEAIRNQVAMGRLLATRLRDLEWEVVHESPLAVVCFAIPNSDADAQKEIAMRVVQSGKAWISTTLIGRERRTVLRACITNYRTGPEDVEALIAILERSKSKLTKASPA